MTAEEAFARLMEIREQYPELTFNNEGYQYIKPEVREAHKEQIEEISTILKAQDPDIVKFNNFKPRKDGTFSIRCQGYYDRSSSGFVGVMYLQKEHFTTPEGETTLITA